MNFYLFKKSTSTNSYETVEPSDQEAEKQWQLAMEKLQTTTEIPKEMEKPHITWYYCSNFL